MLQGQTRYKDTTDKQITEMIKITLNGQQTLNILFF